MSFKLFAVVFVFITINGIDATIYDPVQNIMYTYDPNDAFGPTKWPGVCTSNQPWRRQSPIHLKAPPQFVSKNPLPELQFFGGIDEMPLEIRVINNGFGVFFKFIYHYLNAPKIYGGPLLSDLYQFDSLSYHVINEHNMLNFYVDKMDVELHFLHFNLKYGTLENAVDKPDGLAVIALPCRVHNSSVTGQTYFPKTLLDLIGTVHTPFTEVVQSPGRFTYNNILGGGGPFFSYFGSTTTPPCYESIQWFVFEGYKIISTSDKQGFMNFDIWSGSFSTNRRPIQPRNGRTIIDYN